MCLVINGFKTRQEAIDYKKKFFVAKKDILVYKILRSTNYAPYKNFEYEKGFHYYQVGKPFSFDIGYWGDKWQIAIGKGLHAYTSLTAAQCPKIMFFNSTIKIVEMIVPKGSKYFISSNEKEIVSDNLIWL